MYILQRISDGKYWRNRTAHASSPWKKHDAKFEKANWTTDLEKVRPFLTEVAATKSRGALTGEAVIIGRVKISLCE